MLTAQLVCFPTWEGDFKPTLAIYGLELHPVPAKSQCLVITEQAQKREDV